MLEVYIDGCCEPNPGGTASYGVVVKGSRRIGSGPGFLDVVWEDSKVVGSGSGMSNNVAEYSGLIAFLKWLLGNLSIVEENITIFSDSQLLVNQMSGKWKVRKGLYIFYYQEAVKHLKLVGSSIPIKFKWIPREDNTLADSLAVEALAKVGIKRR